MSLGLIQPGASVALRHPKTGAILAPLYVRANGTAVWPVLGASSDDPDDPAFTGEGDDDDDSDDEDDDPDDEEDDDDEDDKSRRRKRPVKKTKAKSDDDDEDEDDDKRPRAVRQAAKYRTERNAARQELATLTARLKAIEDREKPTDEVVAEDLTEARSQVESLTEVNRIMTAQLAFFKANAGVDWVDASDAFALAEREGLFDDIVDEDGTVDTRELRRALRDLARRKKYLVKPEKAGGRAAADKDDDEEDEDERPRRSARTGNTRRKGTTGTANRAALEKKFPVLRGR